MRYVACSMHREVINVYGIWLERLKGRDCSEDLSVGRWILLKWILKLGGSISSATSCSFTRCT
jgi:hypothetical protein